MCNEPERYHLVHSLTRYHVPGANNKTWWAQLHGLDLEDGLCLFSQLATGLYNVALDIAEDKNEDRYFFPYWIFGAILESCDQLGANRKELKNSTAKFEGQPKEW